VVGGTSSSKCIIILNLFLINFIGIPNLIISLQRCNDPVNGRKCKHVTFRNHGPDNLELIHIMFGNAHVTGASALTPRDLSDNYSNDEVHEVEKITRLCFLVYQKRVRSIRPLPLMEWKIRKRKAHLYHCIRILAARYKKVVEPYEDDIIESENEVFMKH
jgi:hypothetical protein